MGLRLTRKGDLDKLNFKALIIVLSVFLFTACMPGNRSVNSQHPKDTQAESRDIRLLESYEDMDSLLASHKGKTLVLNLWASWCQPCREEMPVLVQYANDVKGTDVEVLGISFDFKDEIDSSLIPYMKEARVEFSVAVYTGENDPFIKRMGHGWDGGIPVTYFVDKSGKIRELHQGPITRKELESSVAAIQ